MENEIICGDALHEIRKIKDNSIDLILTSPPYFRQRSYTNKKEEIGKETRVQQYLTRILDIFLQCCRVIKPIGNIVFNLGDKYIDNSLQLIPYEFALRAIQPDDLGIKLINNITWVKSNPTPHQYNKRLINSTEPFFHFVKSDDYYYDLDAFLDDEEIELPIMSPKKGVMYKGLIDNSTLSEKEKIEAHREIEKTLQELREGIITDFRVKIRGIHKKAYGGQAGGRNSQIDNQGYTIIRMYGKKLKRDIIENSVANTKNINHPAIFPLKVIKELVLLLSPENGIVLDPFCGSGQTCLASKYLNRKYLGIDLNEDYCKLARIRL